MSDINDGSDEPLGMQTEDGELEVREVDGVRGFHETELGQHQRWMRQAPDLFALYQDLISERAALVRPGGVPQPETKSEEVMPSEREDLHLSRNDAVDRADAVPGASAIAALRELGSELNRGAIIPNLAEQIWDQCDVLSKSARPGGVETPPAEPQWVLRCDGDPGKVVICVSEAEAHELIQHLDRVRGAVEPPAPCLRQGCDCKCCDHSEGSDCACECHASGACSARVEPPARVNPIPDATIDYSNTYTVEPPAQEPLEKLPRYAFDQDGSIYGPVDAGPGTFIRNEDFDQALRGARPSPPPAKDLEDQMWRWREAALLKDRTRAAIRDRARAGEVLESLAEDYVVPLAFVQHLIQWQMFGDEAVSPPPATPQEPVDEYVDAMERTAKARRGEL